jgi:hypothetical protein
MTKRISITALLLLAITVVNANAVGIVSGTEKEKLKVGTGEYNKMIDKRIAEIKDKCGITR